MTNDAARLLGRLHDALRARRFAQDDRGLFLVRAVFCLFADCTGALGAHRPFRTLVERSVAAQADEEDAALLRAFLVLGTPQNERPPGLEPGLADLPYVHGELFATSVDLQPLDAAIQQLMVEAARLDWSRFAPAMLGSLLLAVMQPPERRARGVHYTTEKNIRRVIDPLFLDALHEEFGKLRTCAGARGAYGLQRFRQRLRALRVLDPACGCGSFLVVAYQALRELEVEVVRELRQRDAAVGPLAIVNVDQFFGIEISAVSARAAEVAMWMMDQSMNRRVSLEFGKSFARVPFQVRPSIMQADALEAHWDDLLPPGQCSYVLGNPPFRGAKLQTNRQRTQVKQIAALGGTGGTVDYAAAWFMRAAEYVGRAAPKDAPQIGFVATNSITQGEQVAQLWPRILRGNALEITFAHQTFAWDTDATVYVVAIGLATSAQAPLEKRLFCYEGGKGEPAEKKHGAITPYLRGKESLASRLLIVREAPRPINGLPRLVMGTQIIDGGHYVLGEPERQQLLDECPGVRPYVRPYVGTKEFLWSKPRWVLYLKDAPQPFIEREAPVRRRVAAVRAWRLRSRRASTVKLAQTPTLFQAGATPTEPFLVIPHVNSLRREYIPIGWLEPPVIPSHALKVLCGARLWHFALLTSAMHMAWTRSIGGRWGNSDRYSSTVVYNTFPLPEAGPEDLEALEPCAQAVLEARARRAETSLHALYDAEAMPRGLRKAHEALDRAVDKLYRPSQGFASDRERAQHLLESYTRLTASLA